MMGAIAETNRDWGASNLDALYTHGLAFLRECGSHCLCSTGNVARAGARPAKVPEISPFLDSADRSLAALSHLCKLGIGKLVIALHCPLAPPLIASQTAITHPYRQISTQPSIY